MNKIKDKRLPTFDSLDGVMLREELGEWEMLPLLAKWLQNAKKQDTLGFVEFDKHFTISCNGEEELNE